ncbi:Putative uncharacterized protein [Moritella viscosa]|uniref:Uncharacterized protein n=1 Tax=Moritella viscosa TaxID=80854 RepID=A0A1K9YV96_9GAMM|nr:Putative uncharacterized protein [Moritella viscosa]SGY90348.1 Putative uncharacterized protein [Moritella viscosa]SHO01155.1 Putative uncharacterized protein [Moritella viscosa]SHO01438.1 Putative uncharacterized protein [Moritella viscosa]SHO03051.1 Putative uncharacterized protein [Moritella viscosa]
MLKPAEITFSYSTDSVFIMLKTKTHLNEGAFLNMRFEG